MEVARFFCLCSTPRLYDDKSILSLHKNICHLLFIFYTYRKKKKKLNPKILSDLEMEIHTYAWFYFKCDATKRDTAVHNMKEQFSSNNFKKTITFYSVAI